MPRLNTSNPIVLDDGTMAQHYRDYLLLLERLSVPLEGQGSPEGVISSPRFKRYLDISDVNALEYIKLVTDIGGDSTQGWVLIGGAGAGISNHGQLSGLDDDDHPQYFNQTRGDARYLQTVQASDVDSEAATDGFVLTADGAGNAAWEVGGGSDLPITADEINSEASLDGQVLTSDGAGNAAWESVPGTGTVTSVAIGGNDGIEVDSGSPITGAGTIQLGIGAATLRTHINVEDGATADQTNAEIETAYNSQVGQVSAGEKTAGTETNVRRFSPKDVADMAGTHGSGGTGRVLLATITADGSTITEFDFTSISGAYESLEIEGTARSTQTGVTSTGIRTYINGDTSSGNWRGQHFYWLGPSSSTSGGNDTRTGSIPAANAPANYYSRVQLRLPDYTDSTEKMAINSFVSRRQSGGDVIVGMAGCHYVGITAAITRVQVQASSGNMIGTLRLYGVN